MAVKTDYCRGKMKIARKTSNDQAKLQFEVVKFFTLFNLLSSPPVALDLKFKF